MRNLHVLIQFGVYDRHSQRRDRTRFPALFCAVFNFREKIGKVADDEWKGVAYPAANLICADVEAGKLSGVLLGMCLSGGLDRFAGWSARSRTGGPGLGREAS